MNKPMSHQDFPTFFKAATSNAPYDYQSRLADGLCESRLINIPTGLGKTAAVVLAWLYNRVHLGKADWPRRLVYCLPMRTLVEQTRDEAQKWLGDLLWDEKGPHEGKVGLHILMGGEDAGEWDIHPEQNAILIGTQDMLLSRALNRGYGMSRYRWPMHFGLLNNDALWVMDETQLMGVGVETSAQLDGFRAAQKCPTWWMSATLEQARLATVDHPAPADGWPTITLSESEKTSGRPKELITAPKKLTPAPLTLGPTTKDTYPKQLAAFIKERHQPGTLTLVVVNRVSRAREIFDALTTEEKKGKQTQPPLYAPEKVALIHSRFRPVDRDRHTKLLFGEGDRIVIATQAVEAGVDVSARLLITELAPWSSLVQRIGRCNRRADIADAEVCWVDIIPDTKGDLLLPYEQDELDKARAALLPLSDASPQALQEVAVEEKKLVRPIIRRRDLVDLFDTTPDLCGQDLDVSRYIRDGEDSDVQFFWRDIGELDAEKPPQRDELCRVSIGDAAAFLKKADAWTWNPLDEKWEPAKKPRPGAVYLVSVASGGYHDDLGWTGDAKDKPTPHPPKEGINDSYNANRLTFDREWQTIAEHTQLVVAATDALAAALAPDAAAALHTAALWHDVGKAHAEFQAMLRNGDAAREGALWAKSGGKGGRCRPGFRHELASALAWLLAGSPDAPDRDLVAYLIAAHHGKVRLSIRSLPNEPAPADDRLFARGVWDGDVLPLVPGITTSPTTLDLSFMHMGIGEHGPSWLARTVALRDRLGPFRLAYLEAVLRAADARASGANSHTLDNANTMKL